MALPTIETREDLIYALSQAAELKHGTRSQGPSNTLRAHFILDFDLCFTRKFGSI